MSAFLRSWRRKLGCVTLSFACTLLIGWLRSNGIADSFFSKVA